MVTRGENRTLFPARWNVQVDTRPPARVTTVGHLMSRSLDLMRDRFRDVMMIVAATAGVAFIVRTAANLLGAATFSIRAFGSTSGGVIALAILAAIVGGILFVWLQTSITLLVGADRLGVEMRARQALAEGLEAVPAGIWTRTVHLIAVAIGLVCLVVPGLMFLLRFCVAMQLSTFERRSGLDALRASNELVRNRQWEVFERLFGFWLVQVVAAIVGAIGLAIFMAIVIGVAPGIGVAAIFGQLLTLVFSGLAMAFYSIWRTEFYLALVDEERALAPLPLPADVDE
jgi:hypothetical protein